MTTRGCGNFCAGVCLLLLLPWISPAQEKNETRKETRKTEQQRDGLIARAVHLMPSGFAVKLNLTADQRGQIEKLDQEFKAQRREALTKTAFKVMALVESLQEEEDRELAPVLAICHEITGGLLESRRTRMAYEQKMLSFLDEDQKEQFARLKEMGPHERRQQRLAADGGEGADFRLIPSSKRLEGLQLTEEQKKKVLELRQEMETRFRNLLTAEQKQHFDGQSRKLGQKLLPEKGPQGNDK
jgi:hypothetical protein